MMDKMQQIREVRNQLQNPREAESIRRWAVMLAEQERNVREAVRALYETVDDPPREPPGPVDVEARADALCDMVGVQTPGEPTIEQVWLRHCAPEAVVEPEAAEQYVGMDREAWRDQRETWAEMYRDAGVDGTRDELADAHLQELYGIGLDAFEAAIIDWDQTQAMRDLLTAETDATEAALYDLADHFGGETA
ncbi:hypothetical protein ACKVMT_09975 [Halobacteriales archaeon Cl-PHB]